MMTNVFILQVAHRYFSTNTTLSAPQVIRTCLDSEFVPLCIYTWKNLQNELSNKPNFVSSLLLTTTELRCHLQLIVHLLESDIMPDNPNDSFRGNTLGTQILDHYCNIVCADWRYNCFKRVREDALNGLPLSCSSDSSTTSLQSANFYCAGDRPSVPLSTQRPSVPNTRSTPNTSTGRPHSLSAGASTNSTIFGATDVPPQTGLSIATCHQSGSPSQQQQPIAVPMLEQEWHSRLISIAIEDLTSHVNQFPLQVRWVYSELQQTKPSAINILEVRDTSQEALMNTLPNTSQSTTVNGLTTARCKNARLRIVSLDGQETVDINNAYSVADLPLRPVPSIKEEAQRWSHLKDLPFDEIHDAKVTILIGCDVPGAHWVMDQKLGKRGQPFAVRSLLGWVLSGPLQRKPRETVSNNCVRHDETNLTETVTKFIRFAANRIAAVHNPTFPDQW
ncbi:uncharacterized protein DEA37_0003187 [Paragonimus westermani]|uniref:Peptidase aspartic putative domain-containing protein n=1 Tax=Paragonimus westermani TaxID=34504 RepID=A0A5J4NLK6_9TREM|nr:uncharacterized protein DEA37_0003187 [Paragonimus westermani]